MDEGLEKEIFRQINDLFKDYKVPYVDEYKYMGLERCKTIATVEGTAYLVSLHCNKKISAIDIKNYLRKLNQQLSNKKLKDTIIYWRIFPTIINRQVDLKKGSRELMIISRFILKD